MAKRRISITIDSDDETCGACEHVTHIDDDPMSPEGLCVLFVKPLEVRLGLPRRCRECREQEEGRLE